MSDKAKLFQKQIREHARLIRDRNKARKKAESENGPFAHADAKDINQAIESINAFLLKQNEFFSVVSQLHMLLPKTSEVEKFSPEDLETVFVTGLQYGDKYTARVNMSPPAIALISLDSILKDEARFQVIDPNSLAEAKECEKGYEPPELTHTTFDIGGESVSVPIQNEYWVKDLKLDQKFIVSYGPNQTGGISLSVIADWDHEQKAVQLINDLKDTILQSPLIKGKVVEISNGDQFTVTDIGDQPEPIMDERLKEELQKNVINLFTKADEFRNYGLGVKRSVILCGPPGTGKSMIERWLASQTRGKVTTLWVTSKAINGAEDVRSLFEMARKLSPAMIVMEDLDLISGTRSMYGHSGTGALGEMLNQLDGLTRDDQIVLIASTNRLSSLDEALADRPGRFDRVYEVGCPERDLAKQIARKYLLSRGVDEADVDDLNLDPLATGQFTGAQIVEIVKGAIFEAIHRGCKVSSMCIASSCRGLLEQRKLIHKL